MGRIHPEKVSGIFLEHWIIWLRWVFAWTHLLLFFPRLLPHRYDFLRPLQERPALGFLTFNCSLCVSEKQSFSNTDTGFCGSLGSFFFFFFGVLGFLPESGAALFSPMACQSQMKILPRMFLQRMQKDLLRSLVVLLRFCYPSPTDESPSKEGEG